MRKLKKILAIGLSVVMLAASLAACTNSGSTNSGSGKTESGSATKETQSTDSAAGDDNAEKDSGNMASDSGDFNPDTTYKIGYNYFGSGSYALLSLANNQDFVIKAFGNESMAMDDEFNVEKIIQDVENMISSGCDGLIIWLPAESMYETVANICAEAKVPFVLADKIPADASIKASLMANEYFAGAIAPANSVYGEMLAKYALDQGWTKCLISAPAAGDVTDTPRIEAFREVFEGAGGIVYDELHADTADAALPQIENALTANSDVDFVYGSGSDYGIAACNSLQNMGIDAKVLTSGLDSEALNLLQDGTYMEVVNGDFWVCGTFAAIILQNYLDKTPLVDADGNPVWIDDVAPFVVPADQFSLYKECFLDNSCYFAADIQKMSGKYNPDFNYDAFNEMVHKYSLNERLEANGYK